MPGRHPQGQEEGGGRGRLDEEKGLDKKTRVWMDEGRVLNGQLAISNHGFKIRFCFSSVKLELCISIHVTVRDVLLLH